MQLPPRDAVGVIPHDHSEIPNTDEVIRYVPSVHVKYENGVPILSSAAFTASSPPDDPRSSVSVDVKSILVADGKQPPFRAERGEGYVELNVEEVRKLGLQVGWDPLPNNNAHGGIWGVGKSKGMRRKLRDIAGVCAWPANDNLPNAS